MDSHARMLQFIRKKGGAARFDDFSREHLFGETGFFSARVNMAKSRQVPTPSSEPEYVNKLVQHVYALCKRAAQYRGYQGRKFTIVEPGGGRGEFKRAFVKYYNERKQADGLADLRFVSVEPNPNHRKVQEVNGTEVVEGTAQKTGLPDKSVDVVFDDEVLDCLPFRIFECNPASRRITHEAFVHENQGGLGVHYRPVTRDADLEAVERHLKETGHDTRFYRYSPDYISYWKEVSRILVKGGFKFTVDYSHRDFAMKLNADGHRENALRHPYEDDLTHGVDFGMQRKLAEEHGLKVLFSSEFARPNRILMLATKM